MNRKVIWSLIMMFLISNTCVASGIDADIIEVMDETRCCTWTFDSDVIFYNTYLDNELVDFIWEQMPPVYWNDSNPYKNKYWKRNAEYSIFANADLILVDSVTIPGSVFYEDIAETNGDLMEEYTLELFCGENGDYLVIARNGDTVYCMQYVNADISSEYYDNAVMNENVYAHYSQGQQLLAMMTYSYISYFLDGTCVCFIYDTNTDVLTEKAYSSNNGMLIRYFDVCTYDENLFKESRIYIDVD